MVVTLHQTAPMRYLYFSHCEEHFTQNFEGTFFVPRKSQAIGLNKYYVIHTVHVFYKQYIFQQMHYMIRHL